jgi:hypothetical protein
MNSHGFTARHQDVYGRGSHRYYCFGHESFVRHDKGRLKEIALVRKPEPTKPASRQRQVRMKDVEPKVKRNTSAWKGKGDREYQANEDDIYGKVYSTPPEVVDESALFSAAIDVAKWRHELLELHTLTKQTDGTLVASAQKPVPSLEVETTDSPFSEGKHQRWSALEHQLFVEAMTRWPKNWKTIAEVVKTRTSIQCRTHAQKAWKGPEMCPHENLAMPLMNEHGSDASGRHQKRHKPFDFLDSSHQGPSTTSDCSVISHQKEMIHPPFSEGMRVLLDWSPGQVWEAVVEKVVAGGKLSVFFPADSSFINLSLRQQKQMKARPAPCGSPDITNDPDAPESTRAVMCPRDPHPTPDRANMPKPPPALVPAESGRQVTNNDSVQGKRKRRPNSRYPPVCEDAPVAAAFSASVMNPENSKASNATNTAIGSSSGGGGNIGGGSACLYGQHEAHTLGCEHRQRKEAEKAAAASEAMRDCEEREARKRHKKGVSGAKRTRKRKQKVPPRHVSSGMYGVRQNGSVGRCRCLITSWQASFYDSRRKNTYIGTFNTKEEAAAAFDAAVRKEYGVDAVCNYLSVQEADAAVETARATFDKEKGGTQKTRAKSGLFGVRKAKPSIAYDEDFQAYIYIKGKQTRLGTFSTKEEAACAYDRGMQHGQYTALNYIDSPSPPPLPLCLPTPSRTAAWYDTRPSNCAISAKYCQMGGPFEF